MSQKNGDSLAPVPSNTQAKKKKTVTFVDASPEQRDLHTKVETCVDHGKGKPEHRALPEFEEQAVETASGTGNCRSHGCVSETPGLPESHARLSDGARYVSRVSEPPSLLCGGDVVAHSTAQGGRGVECLPTQNCGDCISDLAEGAKPEASPRESSEIKGAMLCAERANFGTKAVPRPVHEVPMYWTCSASGRTGSIKSSCFVTNAQEPGFGIQTFASLASLDSVPTHNTGLDPRYFDLSPTNQPRQLEDLDLKSLSELHKFLGDERKRVPMDLVIPARIGSLMLAVLVDSGATCSVLSARKWHDIHRDNPGLTLVSTSERVQLASGASQPILGKVIAEIELAGQFYLHQFLVMEIMEEAILGIDFLAIHEAECDWSRGVLRLKGKEVEACRQYSLGDGRKRRLTLAENLVLPPNSHTVTRVVVHHHSPGDTPDWAMSISAPKLAIKKGVVIGRAVVDGHAKLVPVPILNPYPESVTLSAATTVGWLEPVEYVGYAPSEHGEPSTEQEPGRFEMYACEREDGSPSAGTHAKVSTISHPKGSPMGGNDVSDSELDIEARESGDAIVPRHLEALYAASLQEIESEKQSKQLAQFLDKYQKVFAKNSEDLGRTSVVQHRIDTGDHPPIKQRPRRIPIHKREIVEEEIQKMLAKGVIEPCDGPWSSPIVLVGKKDGTTRVCVDFRQLNSVTKKTAYPLVRIEDNLDALQGAKWYSTLDLLSGFWQVEVAPEDREKTAFSVGGAGLWSYVTMPMGLCGAPGTFQRLMEHVLAGLQWNIALLYLDDIIVFSQTFKEHLNRLGMVLSRLQDAGLKLKPSKCVLLKTRVEFLGHIVSKEGVEVDPSKVARVKDWPEPGNLTQVKSFLGLCAYYRRFIPDFSKVAKPLTMLSEKDVGFSWQEPQQEAFDLLKRLLTSAPVLAYPKEGCPYVLDTDASDVGIGAVLSQVQHGEERVIAYASKTLDRAQRNYCVTRRELLAIVYFVRYFHHYLYGAPFLVRTDHAALYWLLRKNDPDGQMARWLETLQVYDMQVEHRPGKKHGNADALSRCQHGCRDTDTLTIQPGTKATLPELTERAKEQFPSRPPKVMVLDGDHCAGPPASTEHVRPVLTRKQAKHARDKALEEQDLGLVELFSSAATEPKLSRGATPTRTEPAVTDREVTSRNSSKGNPLGPRKEGPPQISSPGDGMTTKTDLDEGLPKHLNFVDHIVDQKRVEAFLKQEVPDEWTAESIAFMQSQDRDLALVRQWLTESRTPDWQEVAKENAIVKAWWMRLEQLYLSANGVLYLRWEQGTAKSEHSHKIIVTPPMQAPILRALHDSRTAAHLGQAKTVDRLKRSGFYWLGMVAYAIRWVKACRVCAAKKGPKHNKRTPLQNYRVGSVGDRYSTDLCGPFSPPTRRGKRWILTVTDWFTRYTMAYSLRHATAEEVAGCLYEFMCMFGIPLELYSDNGRNLNGVVIHELCSLFGVKKLSTVAYKPSSNGITERENAVIKAMLTSLVDAKAQNWDILLPSCMAAYRSVSHRTLQEAPFDMMFGRSMRLPLDALIGPPPEVEYEPKSPSEYVQDLMDGMKVVHDTVSKHVDGLYTYQSKAYDRHVKPQEYKVGQLVWLRVYPRMVGRSKSLQRHWDEAWVIIKQVSRIHFKIQKTPSGQAKVVHSDRIKPHHGPIVNAATKRLWLSVQPTADKVDRMAVCM